MKHFNMYLSPSLIVSILLALFCNTGSAQDAYTIKRVEFGVRYMPTFTALKLRTSEGGMVKGSATMGFGASAFLGFNFSKNIGVQGEIIYNSISQKSMDIHVERKIDLKYVNIPILISLNTGKSKLVNLNLIAGPQIGINVGSSISQSGTIEANTPQPILLVKKNDIGFAYGAGIDFGINTARTIRLGIGYRGVIGLVDISDKNQNITTNSYYVLDRTHINTNSAYIGLSIMF
jgi:opacity protein-like surface antigen